MQAAPFSLTFSRSILYNNIVLLVVLMFSVIGCFFFSSFSCGTRNSPRCCFLLIERETKDSYRSIPLAYDMSGDLFVFQADSPLPLNTYQGKQNLYSIY